MTEPVTYPGGTQWGVLWAGNINPSGSEWQARNFVEYMRELHPGGKGLGDVQLVSAQITWQVVE